MKAMILAAGFGTRLRPVTNLYAKPAVPFLNIPLLYYSMALLQRAGVSEFVINSHYLPEQIDALAKSAPGLKTCPVVLHEPGEPLGSGGGIWNAKKELKDSSFWLANGDEVILPRNADIFEQIQKKHKKAKALATIVVMEHAGVGTQFGGVWATPDGIVKGFGKTGADFPGTRGYHYIGLQLFAPEIFNYLPEGESNILYDALKSAIANGETVQIAVSEFTWFETGNPHDFLEASDACLKLLRDPSMAVGSDREFLIDAISRFSAQVQNGTVAWHQDFSKARVLAAPSAIIAKSAILLGSVSVGENVEIAGGASISNSVLLPGSRVTSGSVIENQILLPASREPDHH